MASLPARTTSSFDAIKPVSSLTLLDNEFNQYVGASGFLNGGSTATKLLVKTSDGTDPPITVDQIGAGAILIGKQNGSTKFTVENDGDLLSNGITTAAGVVTFGSIPVGPASDPTTANQLARKAYVDAKTTGWSVGWFIDDPSTFTTGDDTLLPVWIVPAGTTIASVKVKVTFYGGSHTAGGSLDFRPVFTAAAGGAGSELATILLDNTNNTARVTYSASCAASLAEGDKISMKLAGRSGTITERKVSIAVHGTQKLT